jgi:HKD family nuclease
MNAARKGVKISAMTSNPLEFNDSTDPVAFFTNIPAQT